MLLILKLVGLRLLLNPVGRDLRGFSSLYVRSGCVDLALEPSCVIVVPVYSAELSQAEMIALRVCASRTRPCSIRMVHKRSINMTDFLDRCRLSRSERERIEVIPIDDHWLASVATYNAMLLQSWFYRLFADWTYLLIFQLDAWILGDDLGDWLAKNYTYVGAPWTAHLGPDTPDVGVGNGGLSLRCVSEMIRICESPLWRFMPVFRWRKLAYRMTLFRRYHLFPPSQRPLLFFKRLCLFAAMSFGWRNTLAYYARIGIQEDHVLSGYAPFVYSWIRIPTMDQAAAFSIETNPRQTIAEYGVKRPFGCHAWEKYDRDFWLTAFPLDFSEVR